MDSTPSHSATPGFWLSSRELTAWALPRAGYLQRHPRGSEGASLSLIRTDPPSPAGQYVIVAPRFVGDSLEPEPQRPVVVNLYSRPDGVGSGDSLSSDQLQLVGVGELYASEAEAAAGDIRVKAARGA